jgi:sulfate transport system substrate-binding protein
LIAANKEPLVLTIASFAVTKLAYVRLTKMFRDQYLSEKGIDVRFRLTFAGSGVQVTGWVGAGGAGELLT